MPSRGFEKFMRGAATSMAGAMLRQEEEEIAMLRERRIGRAKYQAEEEERSFKRSESKLDRDLERESNVGTTDKAQHDERIREVETLLLGDYFNAVEKDDTDRMSKNVSKLRALWQKSEAGPSKMDWLKARTNMVRNEVAGRSGLPFTGDIDTESIEDVRAKLDREHMPKSLRGKNAPRQTMEQRARELLNLFDGMTKTQKQAKYDELAPTEGELLRLVGQMARARRGGDR